MSKIISKIFFALIIILIPHFVTSQNAIQYYDFNAKTPSAKSLTAFEQRAKQKVFDFFDYVEIISDTGYNITLRKHSVELALKLFVDDDCVIQETDLKSNKVKELTISKFLNDLLVSGQGILKASISEIEIANKLQKKSENVYSGSITFKSSTDILDSTLKSKTDNIVSKKIIIVLKKTPVQFEKEKKLIWRVFLGDIVYL